jgi:NADH dehydrogenase FAD-containing subunit
LAPDLEVIVLEKNPIFWSCPMSNKWLVNAVDTDLLAHSYIIPAKKYGYTFVQTEITDIDRSAKTVYTADGFIKYDWLIIAGGIRYAFEAWFGNDQKRHDRHDPASSTTSLPTITLRTCMLDGLVV